MSAATSLVVVVNDVAAVYPVRIDPTFSDADWVSPSGIPGDGWQRWMLAVDASGNLYLGGDFTVEGDATDNWIANWNGRRMSALGSGMGDEVVVGSAVSGATSIFRVVLFY